MGQGFSLSDTNLGILYKGTATKGASKSITQDPWTITVTNLGPKIVAKHVLYSMTAEKNGRVVLTDKFTLLVRSSDALREENDKANMRNNINLLINQITARGEAESKKGGLPLNLKL